MHDLMTLGTKLDDMADQLQVLEMQKGRPLGSGLFVERFLAPIC